MSGIGSQFLEVEHKYLINEQDRQTFVKVLKGFDCERSYEVDVEDHYFVITGNRSYVYRYRRDSQLNQLSVKSLNKDSESRLEVNLNLDRDATLLHVQTFVQTMGVAFSGSILKNVHVFEFSDCEIVVYRAESAGQSVICLELEAKASQDADPLALISQYEDKLGLRSEMRCLDSLFTILLLPQMPPDLRGA